MRTSGRQLRIIPYKGNRAYKYYLDGYKVNGKRRRLFFKDEAAADGKLAELWAQENFTPRLWPGLDQKNPFRPVGQIKPSVRSEPYLPLSAHSAPTGS